MVDATYSWSIAGWVSGIKWISLVMCPKRGSFCNSSTAVNSLEGEPHVGSDEDWLSTTPSRCRWARAEGRVGRTGEDCRGDFCLVLVRDTCNKRSPLP